MKQWTTTEDFINNGKIPASAQEGFIVETEGYYAKGDDGGAKWKFTGVTGQIPSQSPVDLGEDKLTDSNGFQYELVGPSRSALQLGADDLLPFNVFSFSDGVSNKTFTQSLTSDSGSHVGQSRYGHSIEHRPLGSGANGPSNADYGLGISVIKSTWPNADASAAGEIDGLTVVTRNTGPDAGLGEDSDSSGILVNSQATELSGFVAAGEHEASQIDKNTFAILRRGKVQLVPLDRDQEHRVITILPQAGNFDQLMLFFDDGTPTYDSIIKAISGGADKFEIDSNGDIILYRPDGANSIKLKNLGPGLAVTDTNNVVVFEVNQNNTKINLNYRSVSAVGHTVSATSFAPGPLETGLIATDDGTNWSGVNATGSPRPVFYDGTQWIAMT